jgi:hypothetical protein
VIARGGRGRGGNSRLRIPARRRLSPALTLLAAAVALPGVPTAGAAAASSAAPPSPSVLLAFLAATRNAPLAPSVRASSPDGRFETGLASVRGLSVGIMSATQGRYRTAQLLLDITQGARIASSAYGEANPPALSLEPAGAGAAVRGWPAARKRAEEAPQLLLPGLLASRIPGGGAYAGIAGVDDLDGVAASDREGHVAALSLGTASTLLARVAALRRGRRFVVCDLPGGDEGYAYLRALSERRTPGELLVVVQRVADAPGGELLWAGLGGLAGGGGRELSSQSTNQRGLISAVDLAPTILTHLNLRPIPAEVRGDPVDTDGTLRSESLRSLMARLRVIGGRRLRALGCLLGAWALLLLLSAARPGRGAEKRRAWAMRVGAIGLLWAPVAVLIAAGLAPSATVEYVTITIVCLALGALTDRLLPWPRAPLAPAVVTILALVADALLHTQLLMRSLLGPNPILGARFYGFGNELKSGLAVLVFTATAAALYPLARAKPKPDPEPGDAQPADAQPADAEPGDPQPQGRRRAAVAMAGTGVLLAVAEGSARVGAAVGGVVLVCAGTATAAVMLLPGRVTRRRALIALISPVAGLAALAALDLATAHGGGHYTGSILHAHSTGELRDVIVRRYTAAWHELENHAMPVATALALLCAALGVRLRRRLLAPVASDPVWLAAFAGGLTAGVVGALSEDSGPLLLVVATFTLGAVATYLWGRPLGPSQAAEVAAGERPD